ncbi:hypothetical protein L6164_003408 [Bauhinia variegata]|uniref:Uncharacterized protein n=2 Tax=Bauhinia variegata TaxID=167791 RepID=A0ACB9Q3I1_BAUVA|nr:hypothetical protein L6164_003408 [Bauhinia variegata]
MAVASLSCSSFVNALKHCPNCGHTPVPYPLSTGPDCGDQSYKVQCNAGTLWFNALNQSSYQIISINPTTQRLTIRLPGFAKSTCMSADFQSTGLILDPNLPFNITSNNQVVYMNCTNKVSDSWNCTASSICHDYIRDNAAVAKACGPSSHASKICCSIKTGGSSTAYHIKVRKERCSAYESFVNLDISLPVKKWPEPAVELQWLLPMEPVCKVAKDCADQTNSACLVDPSGVRRCLCKTGFRWDPINATCQSMAFSGAAMLTGTLLAALAFFLRWQRKKRAADLSMSRARELISDNSGKSAKIFTSKEVTKATNNFSKDNLLGVGGFGEVFKGVLEDGTVTAIKRAKHGCTRGIDQIVNEVRILCQVNHRSLVRLLGCCVELQEPLLIYEYVPNGTLFDHLHNRNSKKRAPLRWHERLRIAHQTAEGLAYLHTSAIPKIYHRDVKSSNILLDDELNVKVSDFGLSRLAASEASHITTCAQGTLGYLDPDYYINFQLTDKSDVYSFGVVLLELLTSKKAIDFNREEEDVNLVVFAKRAAKEGRLMDVIDPGLKMGARKLELESMKALGYLATSCLDDRRQNRPPMKDVDDEIEYITNIIVAGTTKSEASEV